MKKFLKVTIITLLVVVAIVGTVYLFFQNMKKQNEETGSLIDFVKSDISTRISTNMDKAYGYSNADLTDGRMTVLIKTNRKLNQMLEDLSSYYIDNNTVVVNKNVCNQYKDVVAMQKIVDDMLDEYIFKCDPTTKGQEAPPIDVYPEHLGLNDVYKTSVKYLTSYAKFVRLVAGNVKLANKDADLKFAMIDLYCNVVENNNAIADVNKLAQLTSESVQNINIFDTLYMNNSYVQSDEAFTQNANEFTKYYNASNKVALAKDFSSNLTNASVAEDATNEQKACYYFDKII